MKPSKKKTVANQKKLVVPDTIRFTSLELNCLAQTFSHANHYEIGKGIDLAARTVEFYLNNLLRKTHLLIDKTTKPPK